MPQVMVVARNFMDMVAALPAAKLNMLYDSAFICEAILRSLPALAKKYALQMLYVSAPVAAAAMEEWVLDEYAAKHRVAIDRLLQLRVFVEVHDRKKEVSYKMNQKFQGNMRKYLVDGELRMCAVTLVGMVGTYLNVLALLLLFLLFASWLAYVTFEDTPQGKTIFSSYGATLYQMFVLFTTSNNPDVWVPAYNFKEQLAKQLFQVDSIRKSILEKAGESFIRM